MPVSFAGPGPSKDASRFFGFMTGPDPVACHPDAFLSPVFPAGQDISGKMNLDFIKAVLFPVGALDLLHRLHDPEELIDCGLFRAATKPAVSWWK